MASLGPMDRPAADAVQGHVDAGLLPTNHMFDPSISLAVVKESAKKKPDPQELELQASMLGAHIADSGAGAIKRASSLTIDEHVHVQKPRLQSICENDDHPELFDPASETSVTSHGATASTGEHTSTPRAAETVVGRVTSDLEASEYSESDSDDESRALSADDSDGSQVQDMFAHGPMQWLMKQRQEGVSPRDVLAKLRFELPEDLEIADDDDLWLLAVEEVRDLLRHFSRNIHVSRSPDEEPPTKFLSELTLGGVAEYISSGKCRNIIVMTGAGISTAAGIPDFRSPGSGLYYNLQKYDLPYPQAVFEISYFKKNPVPFVILAKELYPGSFKPTVSHFFSRLLAQKGLLRRHYTQNIDTLERVAGIPSEKLVEAHGSFNTARCIQCHREYSPAYIKELIYGDLIPTCEEPSCRSWIKPDIVFFGEGLPERFGQLVAQDLPQCDLLIVAGTSLKVQPFASIIDMVGLSCPRLLINRESCGEAHPMMRMLGVRSGFEFNSPDNYRDVQSLGACDDIFLQLAEALGWKEELEALVTFEHARLDREWQLEAENRVDCSDDVRSMHVSVEDFKAIYMAEKERLAALGLGSDKEDSSGDSDDESDGAGQSSSGESDRERRSSHIPLPVAASGDAEDADDSDVPIGMDISRELSVQDPRRFDQESEDPQTHSTEATGNNIIAFGEPALTSATKAGVKDSLPSDLVNGLKALAPNLSIGDMANASEWASRPAL